MILFVSYKHFSDLVAYYAQLSGTDTYSELVRFSGEISTLGSWDEMSYNSSNDLFGYESGSSVLIYDYSGMDPTPGALEYISAHDSQDTLLLINREEPILKASDKKNIQKHGLEHLELKPPTSMDIQNLAASFGQHVTIEIPKSVISFVVSNSSTYDEAMNYLYLAQMGDGDLKALEEAKPTQKQALFVLPWRENSLQNDAVTWLKHVGEDELQLGLSLLMTKTLKWRRTDLQSIVIDQLVALDYSLKTSAKSAMLEFKSTLWSIAMQGR